MSKRNSQRQDAVQKVVREQLAKEKRRQTRMLMSGIAILAVLGAAITGWVVYSMQDDGSYNTPAGTYANDAGFAIGNGPKLIEIYSDYQCPICRNFESMSRDTFDQWVAANKVKIIYYPVAILNHYSKNDYSTRSLSAAACAADEGKFFEYHHALYSDQPAENTAGPSDSQLIETGKNVAGLGKKFEQCVKDGKYRSWTKHTAKLFEERKLNGTPSVFIDGKQIKEPSIANMTAAISG